MNEMNDQMKQTVNKMRQNTEMVEQIDKKAKIMSEESGKFKSMATAIKEQQKRKS